MGHADKRVRVSDEEDWTRWKSTEIHDPFTIKAECATDRYPVLETEGEGEGEGEGEEGAYIVDQSAALISDNNASSFQSVGCAFEEEGEEEEGEGEEGEGKDTSYALPLPLPLFLPLYCPVNQGDLLEGVTVTSPPPSIIGTDSHLTVNTEEELTSVCTLHSAIPTLPLPSPLPSSLPPSLPLLLQDTSHSNSEVINVTPRDVKKTFEEPRSPPQLTRKLDGIGK